jgi:SAM-dependent methyltransferase
MSAVDWLDQKLYPNFEKNWDDMMFRQRILSVLNGRMTVLDLGAGAGIVSQMNFRDHALHVCGIDPDVRVKDNPYLHEGKTGTGESIPYTDETFELVFSDNVLEHLSDPKKVFSEILRVLKPGGVFLAKTPNKWHYVPTIARITPLWFHKLVVGWRGRKGDDVFPTLYRANTGSDIRRLAEQSGLIVRKIDYVEGRPEYLRFSSVTYILGWIYERLVNKVSLFKRFRVLLIIELYKPTK